MIPEPAAPERADEGAREVVYRHDAALEERLVDDDEAFFFVKVPEAHEIGVVSRRIDAAHDALVCPYR